jgi:phosphatidylglycerol---prolipoprotein diacylglyceryl transferase
VTYLAIVIDLDPNIVRVGPILITWHGVFSVLGILAAARLGFWLLERDGVELKGRGGDGLAWMVIVGLVGARLLYVWENFRLFSNGQLLRIFALTEGGISQWGGLFGAMIGAYIWSRRTKFSFWKLVDAGGPAAMIGLAVGRIGDVINGEHHGSPTNLPWGVEYVNPNTLGQPGQVVHPEVAYEMVLCLTILGVLLPLHQRLKHRVPDGVLGLIYLGIYAAGRFLLSYLRLDPAVFVGLRQAQLASALMVLIALVAIPVLLRRGARGAAPAQVTPSRV